MQLNKAEQFIIEHLQLHLPATLHYHKLAHTLDVVHSSLVIAEEENVTDPTELILLKTSALYHDCGFLHVYDHHEEEGCRIVQETLPRFSYNEQEITIICNMIMKTKVPQHPETHLEQILCDADLDHLGREDFDSIGTQLYLERKEFGFNGNETEWNEIQITFLESHVFWTKSSQLKRSSKKAEHLQRLKNLFIV